MLTIDERMDRRRSALLSNPCQRRTLLSSSDDAGSFSRQSEAAGKRRKGLLSTPEVETREKVVKTPDESIQQGLVDAKCRKRRALLPESPAQTRSPDLAPSPGNQFCGKLPTPKLSVPLISTPPTSGGVPNSVSTPGTSSNRRVLLAFSTEDKAGNHLSTTATPSSTTKSASAISAASSFSNQEISQKESPKFCPTRQPLLEHSTTAGGDGSELKRKINKSTVTEYRAPVSKSTSTDASAENDLSWLYDQRSLIDQRIAALQEGAQNGGAVKDVVKYVNGYYCHPCRKLFRGDYSTKLAHCQESSHLINADECPNDPVDVFKYYEANYEGIAFDDDDDAAAVEIANSSKSPASSSAAGPSDKWAHHRQQVGVMKSPSGSSTSKWMRENGDSSRVAESDEDDDEDGRASGNERFDRTRISRK